MSVAALHPILLPVYLFIISIGSLVALSDGSTSVAACHLPARSHSLQLSHLASHAGWLLKKDGLNNPHKQIFCVLEHGILCWYTAPQVH